MNSTELKTKETTYEPKTYKAFLMVFLSFLVVIAIAFFLPKDDLFAFRFMKFVMLYFSLAMILIAYIVKKHNRIYWITSYSYEDACKMTHEERTEIASKFFKSALLCYGILGVLLIGSYIIGLNVLIDAVIFVIATIFFVAKG